MSTGPVCVGFLSFQSNAPTCMHSLCKFVAIWRCVLFLLLISSFTIRMGQNEIRNPIGSSPARCHDMQSDAQAFEYMSWHRAGGLPMGSLISSGPTLMAKLEIDSRNSTQRQIAANLNPMALHAFGCMEMQAHKATWHWQFFCWSAGLALQMLWCAVVLWLFSVVV